MATKIIPYNPTLVPLARKLRNNSTLSEILLWNEIKKKQLGYDFHRQKPISNYIVDFYCPALMIAIEIDGSSHDFAAEKDWRRQKEIEQFGIKIVRFDDIEVKKNMDKVLHILRWHISQLEDKS